jgi:hypothetical protein
MAPKHAKPWHDTGVPPTHAPLPLHVDAGYRPPLAQGIVTWQYAALHTVPDGYLAQAPVPEAQSPLVPQLAAPWSVHEAEQQ